jgi:hypothetical protein
VGKGLFDQTLGPGSATTRIVGVMMRSLDSDSDLSCRGRLVSEDVDECFGEDGSGRGGEGSIAKRGSTGRTRH